MNEQLDLLAAPPDGARRRDRGTASAWANEDTDWRDCAWNALLILADAGEPFTSEDLREIVGDPQRPNVMGSIFLRASKRGLIVQTGISRRASRPSLHASALPEWIGNPIPAGEDG